MNYQKKRDEFIQNLYKFYTNYNEELDKVLQLEDLKNHPKYQYLDYLKRQAFNDEKEKESLAKAIILLEFTSNPTICNNLIEILKGAGNLIHEELSKYNDPPGVESVISFNDVLPVIYNESPEGSEELEKKLKELLKKFDVRKAKDPKSGLTQAYPMERQKRGKCIIINNLANHKILDSIIFQHIFKQLHFECEENDLWSNLTASEIKERLEELSKDESRLSKDDDAFILMVISHGTNERVCGYDPESKLEQKVGETVRISTIVDIFSEDNCVLPKTKPKLFFFNCCRDGGFADLSEIEDEDNKSDVIQDKGGPIKKTKWIEKRNPPKSLTSVDENWKIKNKNAFVIYACARDDCMYYEEGYMTDFCEKFGSVLVQRACDHHLKTITNDTNNKMKDSRSELLALRTERDLYFNPGYIK